MMVEKRSGKTGIWVALILLAIAALAAGVFVGISRSKRLAAQANAREMTKPVDMQAVATSSWKCFVNEARVNSASSGHECSVDYTALEHFGGNSYGIMIVAYKDSEYSLDVFRYNPATKDWNSAPVKQDEQGFSKIDTPYVAELWDLPKEKLEAWMAAANKAAKVRYSRPE